jgi:general L-amino acid transport system permease protein
VAPAACRGFRIPNVTTQAQEAPRIPLTRNPAVRAAFYQVAVLIACAAGFLYIFDNTLTNLRERGIASGFGFLRNEAGFAISEALPVPLLQGGFLYFLGTAAFGLLAVYGLSRYLKTRGETIGSRALYPALVILLLIALPAAVVYGTWPSIQTETYAEPSSYTIALVTGLLNTLKVAALGCVLATLLGLAIGLARLSSNWLVSRLAVTYIEVIRNIPLLVQIFFWYKAVLNTLPGVRQSIPLGLGAFINNRGVFMPRPIPGPGFEWIVVALFLACCFTYFRLRQARLRQEKTGEQIPVLWPALAVLVALPAGAWFAAGGPVTFSWPELQGFNFSGGLVLSPEYTALLVALVMYTATFIAEIVRGGIEAISKGQREAASAVGLRRLQLMRLVILPQALRVIVPPLTSQYLNLTKNSSLGVAIAYPEMVSVSGTILNQSGQAIEIIGITMAVYLTFSLLISLGMNWYNARVRLVER